MFKGKFEDFDEAWEKLNLIFLLHNEKVQNTKSGPCSHSFDNFIVLKSHACTLDMGLLAAYKARKWNHLKGSYIDFYRLEWAKKRMAHKIGTKITNINLAVPFKDRKGLNGACLLGMLFRVDVRDKTIVVDFVGRVAEITRRMLVDFVMFHKIIEFVFGEFIGEYSIKIRLKYLTMYQSVMIAPVLHQVFDFPNIGISLKGRQKKGHKGDVENWYYRYITEPEPIKRAMIQLIKEIVLNDLKGIPRESFPVNTLEL